MNLKRTSVAACVLALTVTLGACNSDSSVFDVRVVPSRDGFDSCVTLNHYEKGGWSPDERDASEGEPDLSGVYCRVEVKWGDPDKYYPKDAR